MITEIRDEGGAVIGVAFVHHKGVQFTLDAQYRGNVSFNYEVPKVSRDGS